MGWKQCRRAWMCSGFGSRLRGGLCVCFPAPAPIVTAVFSLPFALAVPSDPNRCQQSGTRVR